MASQGEISRLTGLVGEATWSAQWRRQPLPRPIRLTGFTPGPAYYRQFDNLFRRFLPRPVHSPMRFLEIGCARSLWLPYFVREWGYEVAGLDYSEVGCEQARALLERERIAGTVICQDLFAPRLDQENSFDIIFSQGVVEHFPDTAGVIRAMARYLRPGGTMITFIPNYTGWLGQIKGLFDPGFRETHVLLSREDFLAAHLAAGVHPRHCSHLIFLDPNCVHPGRSWPKWRQKIFLTLRSVPEVLAGLIWLLWPRLPVDHRTASVIVFIGAKRDLSSPEGRVGRIQSPNPSPPAKR